MAVQASRMVVSICTRWGRKHKDLQPKITNTLAKAFKDSSRPITTRYGAIVGLQAFGPLVTHSIILPSAAGEASRSYLF